MKRAPPCRPASSQSCWSHLTTGASIIKCEPVRILTKQLSMMSRLLLHMTFVCSVCECRQQPLLQVEGL